MNSESVASLLVEAGSLMLIGMVFVFSFLGLLIVGIHLIFLFFTPVVLGFVRQERALVMML